MLCTQQRRRRRSNHDKLVWASRNNIVVTGVPDRERRYLSDFYTTLIDIQWRWNLLFFVVCFVVTWLVFASYYFLLCFLHGDLEPQNRNGNSSWMPCVVNINSFTEAYLFSIETMSTIGYGSRYQTEECPGVYMAVMLQSVIGAGLQFALASLVVSKVRRAKTRSHTIVFSNTAVVYQEDGLLKLAVRIGDMRKGDIIGAHATGMLIKKTTGKAGHKVPVRMFTVPFDAESGGEKLFLCWPSLLVHCVDQHSPLWPLSRDDLLNHMYELIVILDGVAATTSKSFQARKSYNSWEILWGRRFKPLHINDNKVDATGYEVNYSTFHETFPVSIPLCSAQTTERNRLLRLMNMEYEDEELVDDDVEHSTAEPTGPNSGAAEGVSRYTEAASPEGVEERFSADNAGYVHSDEIRDKANTTGEETEAAAQTKQTDSSGTDANASTSKERVRKTSRVEFQDVPNKDTQQPQRRLSREDAVNMYRHRRSVTDTYLGTELPEEENDNSEESAAILSILSQQKSFQQEGKQDARDVVKTRRKSTTLQLMFGKEGMELAPDNT